MDSRMPSLPQVNLLPPEVRAARGLTHIKRILGAALLGVLLLAGVGYALALSVSASATADLATAQVETVRLQAEEAKYADVPIIVNGLKRTTDARTLGMASEIQWKGYLDAITAVLPTGASITALSVAQATPSIAAPSPLDALSKQGVALITFTGRAATLPDSSAWIDALNQIPTFYSATFSAVTLEDTSGKHGYTISSTVSVDSTALSHRFDPKSGGN
ncbi:MAG: fimbrial assembly protein [Cellulomonas sp.]|nr:fimbrial assembly protein [Cellulomonas sp.]